MKLTVVGQAKRNGMKDRNNAKKRNGDNLWGEDEKQSCEK